MTGENLLEIIILGAVLFNWLLSALIDMRLRLKIDEIQTKLDEIQTKLDEIKRTTLIQNIPSPSILFPWKVTCGVKNDEGQT